MFLPLWLRFVLLLLWILVCYLDWSVPVYCLCWFVLLNCKNTFVILCPIDWVAFIHRVIQLQYILWVSFILTWPMMPGIPEMLYSCLVLQVFSRIVNPRSLPVGSPFFACRPKSAMLRTVVRDFSTAVEIAFICCLPCCWLWWPVD